MDDLLIEVLIIGDYWVDFSSTENTIEHNLLTYKVLPGIGDRLIGEDDKEYEIKYRSFGNDLFQFFVSPIS